ncbi:MAG TPA: GNAT family N-acetyltransferase [Solirubrobacteraceae bacterium]|nr:GNAT family N-acetyltransferase [Solirubrobacteraceae bacterium]
MRDATPEDAHEVAGVHVRAWQAAYRGLLPDEYLDALRAEERAVHHSFGAEDEDAPRTIVAVRSAAITAFASYGRSRDVDAADAGELFALYVDPPHWSAGTGSLLMTEVEARLRGQGLREAVLWVLVGNEQAERFYRARGYRRDGGHRHERPWGVNAEVIRYRRSLV